MPQKKTFTLKLAYKRLSCLTRKTEFWQTNKHRKSSKILDHLISEEAGGKTIQCHLFGTKCARFSLTDLSLILFVDLPLDVLMLTRWISIQLSKVSNCGRIEATFTLKRQSEICILVKCVARRIRYFFAREVTLLHVLLKAYNTGSQYSIQEVFWLHTTQICKTLIERIVRAIIGSRWSV